jgi:hypothetical protein
MGKWGGEGLYKIGVTRNLKNRYKAKRYRADIACLITVPAGMDMYEAEKKIHKLMWDQREGPPPGEVFRLTEKDIERLKSVELLPESIGAKK